MKIMLESGYFVSEPKKYVDWHAGHKFEWDNYVSFWFKEDGIMYQGLKKNDSIFTKVDFLEKNNFIKFEIDDQKIEYVIMEGTKFEYRRIYNIINPCLLEDEVSIKYHFVPWDTAPVRPPNL